jgi:lysophospholipase L1-like esterase
MDERPATKVSPWLQRLVALLLGTTIALSFALALVLRTRAARPSRAAQLQQALADPKVRELVIQRLVEKGSGIWDSHNDGDVARVLQAGLKDRTFLGKPVSSNSLGLREREFALPKPRGTTRVVLLGDSLVFGEGVEAQDRMGVLLEGFLSERSGAAAPIEVLHVGIGSWNILSECAFLRRQLDLIQPDLVFQLTTSNDLDDTEGARGFGSKSSFTPQRRDVADSRVVMNYPSFVLGVGLTNNLALGIDYEGRSRYALAEQAMHQLEQAVLRSGGKYVAWFHWGGLNDFATVGLASGFSDQELLYNSRNFAGNRSYWVSEQDSHWNRAGMERMARLLYATIQQRGLLPSLALPPWDEADRILQEEHAVELRYLAAPPRFQSFLERQPVGREFVVAELSEKNSAHVNGGLDKRGRISPRASFTMLVHPDGKVPQGTQIMIRGRGLGRSEIDGVIVRVFVDELPLGTLSVPANGAFEQAWLLPAELDGRPYITVHLAADDFVYDETNLQHCVVFELQRISVF